MKRLRDRVFFLLVTFLGCGLAPIAPGTIGSLGALLVAAAIHWAGWWSSVLLVSMAFAACVVNVALGRWIEARFNRKDPAEVVIDEVAGMWLVLAIPVADDHPWIVYGVGFVLFRIFDITKPLGARRLERLPRGWGILLDDVLSAIYVAAILWISVALLV